MSIATLQYRLHHDLLHTLLSLKVKLTLLDDYSRTSAELSRSAFYAIDVRVSALSAHSASPHTRPTPLLRVCHACRDVAVRCARLAWSSTHNISAVRPPRSAHHHWAPSPSAAKLSKLRREATPSADSCGGTTEEAARSPVSSPLCTCCPMADAGCGGGDSCGGRKGSSGGCSISPLCMFCRFGAGEMGDAGSAGAARASSRASASGAGCG